MFLFIFLALKKDGAYFAYVARVDLQLLSLCIVGESKCI